MSGSRNKRGWPRCGFLPAGQLRRIWEKGVKKADPSPSLRSGLRLRALRMTQQAVFLPAGQMLGTRG